MAKRNNPDDPTPQSELSLFAGQTPAPDGDAESAQPSNGEEGDDGAGPGDGRPVPAGGENQRAPLAESYRTWFLEYASYVILDRAVPHIDDGLKPVQRRILHTLWEMDDGRYHKVANVVGACMRFHPHGDASIAAALVGIAQRGYLIDPQGNFGNTLTGDGPAASRYIEARLTKFALEVIFNPKTTNWQLSYDGRAKEPVTLPAKFPLVLLDGAEGIAVGLSTKILPHNFNDICKAAIRHLLGKPFKLMPDFPTGGIADFADYNDGQRGAKVKVRARIESLSKYVLVIRELPFGVTTTSLIESIIAANTKGKIKIKHVDDNTADQVELLVHLPQGADPDQVIQQLYVFTHCQVSISPAACVIEDDRPVFIGVSDILRRSVEKTVLLLRQELEIQLGELEQQWHWDSLERIFIEERIYRRIEKSQTWESVIEEIRIGLEPFLERLRRAVTEEDITRLTEIRIKRISAYNRFKADEQIKKIEVDIEGVKHHLAHLIDYAIAWFTRLQETYGKGRKRLTEYEEIEQISAAQVLAANQRLYVNREEGFIGLNWRQHEFLTECTPMDDVLCIMGDGTLKVSRVADKVFMGADIQYCTVFNKDGPPEYFTVIYQDKQSGRAYAKRFTVGGVTRDKAYSLVASEGSKLLFWDVAKTEAAMPSAVRIQLSARASARVKDYEHDLSGLSVSTRGAKGVTVSKYPVRKITRVIGSGA